MASRRQVLAADRTQTQALSPSIRKKNVRNVPRIAIVATWPIFPAMLDAAVDAQALSASVASETMRPISGGMLMSASRAWTAATPAPSADRKSATYGRKASAITTTIAMITTPAPTNTAAAALIRDQPRSRRRRTNGAKVAATIPASRMDAVTVQRITMIWTRTNPNAIAARSRQPTAARRVSQPGTSWGASSGGGAVSVIAGGLLRGPDDLTVRRV